MANGGSWSPDNNKLKKTLAKSAPVPPSLQAQTSYDALNQAKYLRSHHPKETPEQTLKESQYLDYQKWQRQTKNKPSSPP